MPNLLFAAEKSTQPQLERVNLQLKWFHTFQFSGFYAAKEQGYYADEGLDVEIIERSTDKTVIGQVVSGQAEYGIEASGIILDYAQGAPVKILAAIFQHNPIIFMSKKSSGIMGPHDMAGKRIMMFDGDDGANETPLKALLFDAQLSKQQYTHIPHTFDDDALILDQADVISGYLTNQPFYYRDKGVDINIINPQSYGLDFYGDLLFTTQTELDNYPERAKRFRRASLKGWRYALEHQEELVQLIYNKYKSKSSLDGLRFEAEKTSKLLMADNIPLGNIEPKRFRHIADIYYDLGLIPEALTNDEIKDFIYAPPIDLRLTQEEHQWLQDHPVIRVGIDRDFAPHEWIDEEGNYVGHAADYLKLLEWRLNIKFDIVKDKPWPAIIAMAKAGAIDIISEVVNTPERQEYLNFTQPYIESPIVIVNDISHTFVGTVENLYNKKVAIEESYFVNELLKHDHPEVKTHSTGNIEEALQLVARGQVDAYIGDAATVNYAINKTGLLNLRFSGQTQYVGRHSIGIIKSHPLLLSIMDKALASISDEERAEMTTRWLGLRFEQGVRKEVVLKYAVVALILFILFLYWVFRLRKEVAQRKKVESELIKTQERFIKSQQFASFGVWDWNILTDNIYWSDTLNLFLGCKENTGFKQFITAVHQDDRQRVINRIHDSIKKNHPYEIECRVMVDGMIRWLHGHGNVIQNNDGKPVQMLGILMDITQRKLTDDVLKTLAESNESENENIFRLIVRELALSQNVKYGVVGRINEYNPSVVETLAIWDDGQFQSNINYALKNSPCENVFIEGYKFYLDNVQALFPKDLLLAEMQAQSYIGFPLKDSKQKVIGILALLDTKPMEKTRCMDNLLSSLAVRAAMEIERKKTAESLQIASLVYQSTREAMMMTDSDNNIVAINPAFTEITGYSEQDVLGRNVELFTFYRVNDDKRQWQGELVNKSKEGREYTEWRSVNIIFDDNGEIYRQVSLFSDITKQKLAEKFLKQHRDKLQDEVKRQTYSLEQAKVVAEQANQAKTEFLANMSHELRTPLHGILSFAHLGLKSVEKEETAKLSRYFDRIKTSGGRLLVLLDNLLDLSKLESGSIEISKAQFNLYDLVKKCIDEQEAWVNENQLKISWKGAEASAIGWFDHGLITQVVTNLVSNAIKFSEPGQRLYISIDLIPFNNVPVLHFSLRDEGLGIPENELETVFDKFVQSSKTSTGAGGAGLGLSICKQIISAHDGSIWAKSPPEGGVVFQFVIPVGDDG